MTVSSRPERYFRLVATIAMVGQLAVQAHDTGHEDIVQTSKVTAPSKPLPIIVEQAGPVKAPAKIDRATAPKLTGQGFWKFVPVTEGVLPIPAEAQPALKGAHGTIVIDKERDIAYWGLENIGWVAFSERLTKSAVIHGDPAFSKGNLHGADILPRKGKLPLVAVADNVEGEVYLSDTTFQKAEKVEWPGKPPYKNKGEFHPTDVAFTGPEQIFITDGYGRANFMAATTAPLRYEGDILGGKEISQTPHGVTHKADSQSLVFSARPEAQLKTWSLRKHAWTETDGLPGGSTVCDIDIWGDYALAPCLDGPANTPGPIYIVNLKKKAIVSTLRAKEDLGFPLAQHIHDAAWYVVGKGSKREVYVLFTNWNPGGIGAMKLVNVAD